MIGQAAFWRWLAVGLLSANLVAVVLYRLAYTPSEPVDNDPLPPLSPDLPRLELAAMPGTTSGELQSGACYSIGPLMTLLAQQRAGDRLRPFAENLRERRTQAIRDRGWWVYLPAGDRGEALELTRSLAERGVEDYYVVASGELENTVSVGLYENLENARQRQAGMRALDFNAQLEVRRETVPQFWIDYRLASGGHSPWQFIVRASPGAQQREIPCFDEE